MTMPNTKEMGYFAAGAVVAFLVLKFVLKPKTVK